jgi:hypothetical protein
MTQSQIEMLSRIVGDVMSLPELPVHIDGSEFLLRYDSLNDNNINHNVYRSRNERGHLLIIVRYVFNDNLIQSSVFEQISLDAKSRFLCQSPQNTPFSPMDMIFNCIQLIQLVHHLPTSSYSRLSQNLTNGDNAFRFLH